MSGNSGMFRRVLGGLWQGLTVIRQLTANLIILAFILVLVLAFCTGGPAPLPQRAALILNPVGTIVEQASYAQTFRSLFETSTPAQQEVPLRDVLAAIRRAGADPRITALVLELGQLYRVDLSKAGEINAALQAFRATGKRLIAHGDYFSQQQYLLAAQADEVIMHPLGGVGIEGFAAYRWYLAEALAKLSLDMHVFRAGDMKSYADPYLYNAMPEAEREATGRWLNALWGNYTDQVESARELAPGTLDRLLANYVAELQARDGDSARLALETGLVDRLATRQEVDDYLLDVVGESDGYGVFSGIPFEDYLQRTEPPEADARERVSVITASGPILDGEQPAGLVGGDSLAMLLREELDNDAVKAIVLRVESGGGSAFASEIIRQGLLEAQQRGVRVVVSMGSVAASGGYWIAASADEIWATPTTLTGSIGVIATLPTADKLLARLGVHPDGVGTTALAGAFYPDRPLPPAAAELVQVSVDHLYDRFITLVATGRNMTTEAVDPVAGGRIWTGQEAVALGLVDSIGSLDEAIAAAGALAQLEHFRIHYVEPHLSPWEQLTKVLNRQFHNVFSPAPAVTDRVERLLQPLLENFALLARLNDPANMYARCLGCVAP